MEIVLIIFVLTIKGSYAENVEAPADGYNADTVQFFIESNQAWRIKTFAIDQDVHVYSLGIPNETIEEKVIASTERSYRDVLAKKYIIRSKAGIDGIKVELKKLNLSQDLEISNNGFAFWVPANTQYRTKTKPK
ncbi:hypothetical protein [Paraglaciecola hydrolytica]|uniref:Uncharacterized protein n=1 Tax=Paraglaciecola hydrolytica TaxID=1799789 RepID=A0A136A6J2_9ALTE|nr:hypothetical protein [Paraglaciecola hydrolytica]KXI30847.1 hypothetical protein AX660_05440 [Paraglaciecola hydrolytica]